LALPGSHLFEIASRLILNGFVMAATGLALTEADLRAAAGERSFERGARYLGAVASLEMTGNQVIATVRGSEDYLVVLTLGDEAGTSGGIGLRAECGCPYGQEGFFCKHCVAVGLTVLARAQRPAASPGPSRSGTDPSRSDLGSWLSSLSRDELLAIVYDQAVDDEDWKRRLELKAASATGDLPTIRDRAVRLLQADDGPFRYAPRYGYLEGPDTSQFARRVRSVTEVIRNLTRTGRPAEAMGIAEQATAAIAESSRHASDRAGVIGAAAADLADAHQEACQAAAADPAGVLAVYRRLIDALKTQAGDGAYERMAQLLKSARACHSRLGTEAAFDAYLRALRDDQKRNRKLISVLDAHLLRPLT
jgi:uncharacterized Zn finger protein